MIYMTRKHEAGARVPTLIEDDVSVNQVHTPNPTDKPDISSGPMGRPTSDRHQTETAHDIPMNGITGTRIPEDT